MMINQCTEKISISTLTICTFIVMIISVLGINNNINVASANEQMEL